MTKACICLLFVSIVYLAQSAVVTQLNIDTEWTYSKQTNQREHSSYQEDSVSRSPRASAHLAHLLEGLSFVQKFEGEGLDEVGDGDTLSEYLWNATAEYHTAALNSAFVQGMKDKSLNPERFGAYMVQDAIFCYMATEGYKIVADRTQSGFLKDFFMARIKSYASYTDALFKTWHIENPSAIKLGGPCANYVNHERSVASNKDLDPVYFVVAVIPCARLWPWIGQQLHADSGNFGVYTDWVKANFSPDSSGVKKYEDVINAAEKAGHIDRKKALDVYKGSMMGEAGFFNSISVETEK